MATPTLTIELLQDIAHFGRNGEIITVSSAQARNMLIPKGLAREVTADRLKQIEEKAKKAKDQNRLKLEKSYEIQTLLDGQTLEYTLKGKGGKVFGGVNEHDIAVRIKKKWDIDFEKRDIGLPNKTHIKTAGTHLVYLHITRDTLAKIIVEVSVEDS